MDLATVLVIVTVYVLRSIGVAYRYVGITKDLKDRLERHNGKRNLSTRKFAPFKLIHQESYPTYQSARLREKFLKSGAGRKFLDTIES